ncbi:MAG TPA: hypothetical protein VEG36_09475 [Burkholderiales bacterium]|nr:hypothetical protein [Burkholderiales bacterium]
MAADGSTGGAVAYEIINGQAYPVVPADSKMYSHEVVRIGGKATLLFAEFDRWLADLWRGRSLGYTVAVLSATISAVLFFVSRRT